MNTFASGQLWAAFVGGIATIAIFSYLYRENWLFRVFEHLFIGIAAGFGLVVTAKNFLWPQILVPLFGLDIVVFPDGTVSKAYDPTVLLYLLPMAFGLLYYALLSPRHSWLAKLVIGFSLGMSGGIAFKGFFSEMLPQLVGSFKPLVVLGTTGIDLWASASNVLFVFTLFAVSYYFLFSFQRRTAVGSAVAISGRWLMMICFGAFFGSTVMARMALLVERVQFLLIDWPHSFSIFGGG